MGNQNVLLEGVLPLEHNFRAALNGFNRADVVNYIEECSVNHARELRQLRDENARLRTELERLEARTAEAEAAAKAAEAAAAARSAEAAEAAVPEPAPQPAPPQDAELAAYRRAEAAERAARQRAAELSARVHEILTGAGRQFDAARGDVDGLMSDLNITLRRLNDAFAQLRMAFGDTEAALAALPKEP